MHLNKPRKLLAYKRANIGTDLEQYTAAELVLLLGQLGWKDAEQRKSKKVDPYKLRGTKIWYWSEGNTISKLYLRALIAAPDLFKENIVESIHHFQSQAYYKALLAKCSVLPNHPLAYYKLEMKKRSNPKAGQPNCDSAEQEDSDMEYEFGSLYDVGRSLFATGHLS